MSEESKKKIASKMIVTRQFTKSGELVKEDSEEELIEVHCFPENVTPASVTIMQGLTLSLPTKYEMAKVNASVTVPCYLEEIDAAEKFAEDFCTRLIREKVKKIRKVK